MKISINPYITGNPVGNTNAFLGRLDVLQKVLQLVRHPHNNTMVLFGQRRIGKTSVLQHLTTWLPEQGPYRAVFFDLEGRAEATLGKVVLDWAQTIARELNQPDPDLEIDPASSFKKWLEKIVNNFPEKGSLALLLDEFDALDDPKVEQAVATFFPYLRELVGIKPSKLKFVFAIGRNVKDLQKKPSLFKAAESPRISLMEQSDTQNLIRLSEENKSLQWREDALTRIWELTHGHPLLTQEICSAIWERVVKDDEINIPTATQRDVDNIILSVLDSIHGKMEWLWNGLPPAERVVLSALAEYGPSPMTDEVLSHLLRESGVRVIVPELENAPQILQEWDLIEPIRDAYQFRVELLRQWMEKYKPLDQIQKELYLVDPIANKYYQIGKDFYWDRKLNEAIAPLRDAVRLNPNHFDAGKLLARILLEENQLQDARDILEQIYEYQPRVVQADLVKVLLAQANAAESAAASADIYKRILTIDPNQPEAVTRSEELNQLVKQLEQKSELVTWQETKQLGRQVAEYFADMRAGTAEHSKIAPDFQGGKKVLAIGVGGTGKATLTILKERLIETYGCVPDNVVLLSLDTDDLRDEDVFADVRLTAQFDHQGREPEYRHIVSTPGMTMNTIFSDIASGKSSAYMQWLERNKLDRILSPGERDIRGGAQQRRPIGRVALFLGWSNPIYHSIVRAITKVYGEWDSPYDWVEIEKNKRQIFIVGSVAGGTGSGFFIDVANLVRHAVQANANWQSIDVSGIIVLPDAFKVYTTMMDDPTNLKPNSYAALRELDRFTRAHSAGLPYMVRYGTDTHAITWSTNQPLDHLYLVDTASRSASQDMDLGGNPMVGVFPLVADFMMAYIDQSIGDALASLRSNAGQYYDGKTYPYSSFNVKTFIFPVDDVIQSFSFRFLREFLAHNFLPILNNKKRIEVEQKVEKETELLFSGSRVHGKVNPAVIAKSMATTRLTDPEIPDLSWPGLFSMITLSDRNFAKDYEDLEGWLTYARTNMVPSKIGEKKHEDYAEGYTRLKNLSDQLLDDLLGRQYDPDDEEARKAGQWDIILGRYRNELRQRFAEALDAALRATLNQRQETGSKRLDPARLPSARIMVAYIKARLVKFKALLKQEFRDLALDTRLRHTSEDLRNTIIWMQETKDTKTFALLGKPDARKAQDSYIGLFLDKLEMSLHQRVFYVVLDVLDALGAAERDKDGNLSVLEQATVELENWEETMLEVDKIVVKRANQHEENRAMKRRVKVRRYLTNPEFEDELYRQSEHSGLVAAHFLGQVGDKIGITWERLDEMVPFHYKLVSPWFKEAKGGEKIATRFLEYIHGLFQVVRESVTVTDRIAAEFSSPASFVNVISAVDEPLLRYNPSVNGKPMFHERFLSYNPKKAQDEGRDFLEKAKRTLDSQGRNVDTTAESQVACTVVEIARGVKLSAVDQFSACEPDYRAKLYTGRESLHLFPEEQVAIGFEGRIDTLGEPDNRQRSLAPELVVTMESEAKFRAFTLACAYGLITRGRYQDDESGEESVEILLKLERDNDNSSILLSQRRQISLLDPRFQKADVQEQTARMYLNALQTFVLKVTAKEGVSPGMVATLVSDLKQRNVVLNHIPNPFTVTIRDVNYKINQIIDSLGPDEKEDRNPRTREAENAHRRVEQYLKPFLADTVQKIFKASPVPAVFDMGTVMHLVLKNEISTLEDRVAEIKR